MLRGYSSKEKKQAQLSISSRETCQVLPSSNEKQQKLRSKDK